MELRPYQQACIDAVNHHLATRADQPLVVCPTGSGKTLIFAHLIREWMEAYPAIRILVLADRVELVAQAADKLRKVWPSAPVGIYAASLNSRDTEYPITVAQIQSIYSKSYSITPFDVVIVDEAHTIPFDGEGRYQTFLTQARKCNPHLRVVGFTATPYRMDGGHIAREDGMLNHVCYEADVEKMISDGYLCSLRSKGTKAEIDTTGVKIRQGDFAANELEAAAMKGDCVPAAVKEIVERGADRAAWLVFCTGVAHAHAVARELVSHGITAPVITGDTDATLRRWTLEDFDQGKVRCVVNVNCLTTGLDVTRIDLIALLRPTKSTSLYVQMVGRGFRLHPDKADCLVLDFGGNVRRHGPINRIRISSEGRGDGDGKPPVKECPQCQEFIPISVMECTGCGYIFPEPEKGPTHEEKPETEVAIIEKPEPVEFDVTDVEVSIHEKRGGGTPTLRVTYYGGRLFRPVSEWICFGHTGYARSKAEAWWRARFPKDPIPASAEAAIASNMFLANAIKAVTHRIKAEQDGKYMRVVYAHVSHRKPQLADQVPF